MILKDLLDYFGIVEDLPDYLLNQTFNKVFLDGKLTKDKNAYEIAVTTRQNVTHHLYIKPGEEFPVIVLSELPSGLSNGMKFPQSESIGIPISKL